MLRTLRVSRSIVMRAIKIALIVGSLLAVVNHIDEFLAREFSSLLFAKVALTFVVPFCVSLYSSAAARRDQDAD